MAPSVYHRWQEQLFLNGAMALEGKQGKRTREQKKDQQRIEKLKVRRAGMGVHVDLHVQADPAMSLHDAHELSGAVKGGIRAAEGSVLGVLVHMEPYEGEEASATSG